MSRRLKIGLTIALTMVLAAGGVFFYINRGEAVESQNFNASSGTTLTSKTGLVVQVHPVDSQVRVELKISRSEHTNPIELGLFEVYRIYNVSIYPQGELAEHPRVTITFPPDPERDITEAVVLHEVDGEWIIAEGELIADETGITLITDKLSRFAYGYLMPLGKMPPITNQTDAVVDEHGNLQVSVILESATSSYFNLGGAPWYKVVVQNNGQLRGVAVPSDVLFGHVVPRGCYLGPEGAQELALTFYGTGGKTTIKMNADGLDLMPIIGVDMFYTLVYDGRMPWPIEPKHALADNGRRLVEFYELLSEKIDEAPGRSSPFLSLRAANILKWMFDEAWTYAQDKSFEIVFKKWVAFARVSDIIINRVIYALMGFDEITFEVIASPGDFTVEITPNPATVSEEGSITFTAKAFALDGVELTAPSFTWTVSGGGTIDQQGRFTAAPGGAGQYTVTATASGVNYSGSTIIRNDTTQVTVTPNTSPVTGVKLNRTTLNLSPGGTSKLSATVSPANATNKEVIWTSSNNAVATVSGDGLVTATGLGTATITATTASGSKTATCKVTVAQVDTIATGVGNLVNGGQVVTAGERVFLTTGTNFGIHRMRKDGSDVVRIWDKYAYYLNAVDSWIYFAADTWDAGGIYRIKHDGSGSQKIRDEAVSWLTVKDGWMYYVSRNDGDNIFRARLDGSNRQQLNQDLTKEMTIASNWIYYVNEDDNSRLYKVGIDGTGRQKLNSNFNDGVRCLNVYEGWIYYSNISDNGIYRVKVDGTGRQKLGSHNSSYLNVASGWVYYRQSSTEALYRMRVDGTGQEKISWSITGTLNIVDGWVYFMADAGFFGITVRVRIDGSDYQELDLPW